MVTKEEIISKLASDRTIENLIENITHTRDEDFKDLAQDLYLDLLNKDDDKIISLWEKGEMNYFIVKMITNSVFSANSPYYYLYKKFPLSTEELKDYEDDRD